MGSRASHWAHAVLCVWVLQSNGWRAAALWPLTSHWPGLSAALSTTFLWWRWSFSVPGDPADTDYTAVGCAITTISSNLTEMSKGVKLLAALMDDEVGSGEDLLRAARTLAGAVSDLLKAVQPTSGEVSSWGKPSLGFWWDRCSLWVSWMGLFLSCSFHPDGGMLLPHCRACRFWTGCRTYGSTLRTAWTLSRKPPYPSPTPKVLDEMQPQKWTDMTNTHLMGIQVLHPKFHEVWINFLPSEWDSLAEHFQPVHLLLVCETSGISLRRFHQDVYISLSGRESEIGIGGASPQDSCPCTACLLALWRKCIFFPSNVCSLFIAPTDGFDCCWKHWTGQWGSSETDRREWDWWAIPSKIFAAHSLGKEPKWWSRPKQQNVT